VRRLTAGQGNLKESGTENIPPAVAPLARWWARVKRCGKSAPRSWQHGWQAKPRTEQGQIGRRFRTARPKPPGRPLEPVSDDRARGMIVTRRRRRDTEFGLRPAAAGLFFFAPVDICVDTDCRNCAITSFASRPLQALRGPPAASGERLPCGDLEPNLVRPPCRDTVRHRAVAARERPSGEADASPVDCAVLHRRDLFARSRTPLTQPTRRLAARSAASPIDALRLGARISPVPEQVAFSVTLSITVTPSHAPLARNARGRWAVAQW